MRAFVSLPVEGAAADALIAVEADLAPVAPPVRWVGRELMHVTLKFLGSVDDAQVPQIVDAVTRATRGVAPFAASIAGLGAFPKPSRPSVVWAGVGRGREAVTTLAHAVEEALAPMGFAREERAFRAHVTLARVRDRLPIAVEAALARRLDAESARPIADWRVDRVELMQSVTGAGGPTYSTVATVPLEGA